HLSTHRKALAVVCILREGLQVARQLPSGVEVLAVVSSFHAGRVSLTEPMITGFFPCMLPNAPGALLTSCCPNQTRGDPDPQGAEHLACSSPQLPPFRDVASEQSSWFNVCKRPKALEHLESITVAFLGTAPGSPDGRGAANGGLASKDCLSSATSPVQGLWRPASLLTCMAEGQLSWLKRSAWTYTTVMSSTPRRLVMYMRCACGKASAKSLLSLLGLSPKKVADDIANVADDERGLRIVVALSICNRAIPIEGEPRRDRKRKKIQLSGNTFHDPERCSTGFHNSRELSGTIKEILGLDSLWTATLGATTFGTLRHERWESEQECNGGAAGSTAECRRSGLAFEIRVTRKGSRWKGSFSSAFLLGSVEHPDTVQGLNKGQGFIQKQQALYKDDPGFRTDERRPLSRSRMPLALELKVDAPGRISTCFLEAFSTIAIRTRSSSHWSTVVSLPKAAEIVSLEMVC
ncbi:60S ribosomal protein L12, partial [Galemys pyrenaicus]